jgi:ribosomal protein L15
MKYNELNLTANKNPKRVGRGISAGQGKTAGRGTKGQGARTGHKKRAIFQGGSRSLVQAVPKARGFKSKRPMTQVVYLDNLSQLKGKEVDNFLLAEEGFIKTPYLKTKVITRGEIDGAITLKVQAVSKSSLEAIQKAGGSFIATPVPQRAKQDKEAK